MNENEKNWLIRTKNKKIFGPVSKNKVQEFIEKGSLTEEDELSSGNGYWFWIKEKDYLEKFLYQGLSQGFNPIAEADTVIATSTKKEVAHKVVPEVEEVVEYPEMDDLEYPDVNQDVTQPGLPIQDNVVHLEAKTKVPATKAQKLVQAAKIDLSKTSNKNQNSLPPKKTIRPKKQRDDRFLIYALVLLFLLVGWLTYFYYVKVLNEPLPFLSFDKIIKPAYAQTYSPGKKKILFY